MEEHKKLTWLFLVFFTSFMNVECSILNYHQPLLGKTAEENAVVEFFLVENS
jgi:hypothetical protein